MKSEKEDEELEAAVCDAVVVEAVLSTSCKRS
jgi:hypothetical protein